MYFSFFNMFNNKEKQKNNHYHKLTYLMIWMPKKSHSRSRGPKVIHPGLSTTYAASWEHSPLSHVVLHLVHASVCNTLSCLWYTCRCRPRAITGLDCVPCLAKISLPAVSVTCCLTLKMLLQAVIFRDFFSQGHTTTPKDPCWYTEGLTYHRESESPTNVINKRLVCRHTPGL